ncbi:MAG: Branched-chain amino acid transporter, amino acid-binding protein [Oscillospiraceae bacterium]|nr:Branched-chain amino acid transporter, amino acid-binding protein [Oscillospiraceae bacterium]
MKKIVSLSLVVALLLALNACGGFAPTASGVASTSADVIKIGVYEPASGDNAQSGKQETLGIQYANSLVNTVNINGKDYPIKLVIVDNQSSAERGPLVADSLVRLGISAVIGSYGSAVTIAASDVFSKAGIPGICATCTNPQVTMGNTNYFTLTYLDPFQGSVLANFAANSLKAKTVYCLAQLGDNYSVDLCYYFRKAFEALGGRVVYSTFLQGNTDFGPYLDSAKSSGADVFFAPLSIPSAENIIKQASAQNFAMPLLAGDSWDSKAILDAAKGTNLDIYVTTYFDEKILNDQNSEFVKGFKKWINSRSANIANNGGNDTIVPVSVMAYDAYFTIIEAIKSANSTDPKAINEALWKVNFEGISGPIAFDETGNIIRNVAFIKKVNTKTGEWEVLGEKYEPANKIP